MDDDHINAIGVAILLGMGAGIILGTIRVMWEIKNDKSDVRLQFRHVGGQDDRPTFEREPFRVVGDVGQDSNSDGGE